jgi:LysM repeat protein
MSRYIARFLAPLAIAAVAVGVYVIVHDNLGSQPATVGRTTSPTHHHRHHRHHAKRHRPRYYRVQSGDTLSEIAHKTGVSMVRLESLNPSLTPPFSLQTGQRLRLRR